MRGDRARQGSRRAGKGAGGQAREQDGRRRRGGRQGSAGSGQMDEGARAGRVDRRAGGPPAPQAAPCGPARQRPNELSDSGIEKRIESGFKNARHQMPDGCGR